MSEQQLKQTQDLESGRYRIEVVGKVGTELWDYFEGEVEGIFEGKNGVTSTSLLIRAQDQAELAGVINLLNNWRLVILSVNRVEIKSARN